MSVFVCFRLGVQARVPRDVCIGVCVCDVYEHLGTSWCRMPPEQGMCTHVSLRAPAACTRDVGCVHTSVRAAPCWVHAGSVCTLGVCEFLCANDAGLQSTGFVLVFVCVCKRVCVYTGVYVHVCTLRHGMGGGWTMSGGLLASKEQVTAMEAHHLLSLPDVHSPAAPGGHRGLSHPVPTVSWGLRCCCALGDGDRGWGQAGTVAGTATPLPTRSLLRLAPFASLSLQGGTARVGARGDW